MTIQLEREHKMTRMSQPPRSDELSRKKSGRLGPYLYVLPALILVAGVVHFGIVANVVYSTWDWTGVSPQHEDVGLDNYWRSLGDATFWQALGNTGLFALVTVTVQMFLGYSLAILVRTRTRGRALLRTLLFVPVVLSPAIVATSFRLILTPDGQFNELLSWLGLPVDQPWLADPRTAIFVIAAINIWQYTGYSFVIYDAAIAQIDPSLIEAAHIDGASTSAIVGRIVGPLVSGSHMILIVLGAISALKTFDLVFLTTGGGPGVSTEFLSTYIYRLVITQFDAGYGATLSVILVVVALIFAVAQVRMSQRAAQ